MPHAAGSALVLRGGGALGAYELGAAQRLYEDDRFAPDLIAGVSIGAITAVLLARPAAGLRPLAVASGIERWAAEGYAQTAAALAAARRGAG
jgi:predicted acylesterase/phospholipase RssA